MWTPISRSDFDELFQSQLNELSPDERSAFERFRVPIQTCTIRRNDSVGNERVFVVARTVRGVMYFDDVEFGFNVSTVDDNDQITNPGGSQYSLSEALRAWLMSKSN